MPSTGPELPAATTNSVPVCAGQRVERERQRIRAVARVPAAEAHVHHVGPARGPLHPGDHPRVGALAAVVEHLADDQVRVGGHAPAGAARGRAGARDQGRHMGAVAVAVAGVTAVDREVHRLRDLSREVRVGGVDAGVQHRDPSAVAGVPGLPRLGCGDLAQVGVHPVGRCGGRPYPPVQPNLRRGGHRRRAGRHRLDESRARGLRVPARDRRDTRQRAGPGQAGDERVGRRLACLAAGADDERQVARPRVVVAVEDQRGHVEQRRVQRRVEQRRDGGRHAP